MSEKLIINANLLRKESEFRTKSCVVEKAIAVPHSKFDDLKRHPLRDNMLIAENAELMYSDRDDNYHCLLIYDEEQGDGLLTESEGTSYARYAQYIPSAKELVERHQAPEISLTNSEKKLHELLHETADRMAIFAHLSYSEFSLDDVLQELDCDFDDVKKMLVEAAAEMLNERNDISSVRINDLNIPFQPDISVEINPTQTEEIGNTEDLSEEIELISGDRITNRNISSNMQRSKFYVCPICGNVIHSTGEALISCCGITLPCLEAEETDNDHYMNVEYIEDESYITIKHEMTKENYISFIAYVTSDKIEIKKLYPEGNAESRFFIRGDGELYCYCNHHGLLKQKFRRKY